jgi:hypothetical protein
VKLGSETNSRASSSQSTTSSSVAGRSALIGQDGKFKQPQQPQIDDILQENREGHQINKGKKSGNQDDYQALTETSDSI